MSLPTEPIGSIPRPRPLIEAMRELAAGRLDPATASAAADAALRDTLDRFAATGSPVITDGEQTKPSFATYPIHGLANLAPDGVTIPFADGHTRRLPRLTGGPFRYRTHAADYVKAARRLTSVPLKQAVISASALSLLYPAAEIPGYPREEFLRDLVNEAEADVRGCLDAGACAVQIDFTEARLSVKLDPSRGLLRQFVDLNNQVLDRFSADERRLIGVHTCPGGDQDSTHSADVDYAELLPDLFALHAGRIYLQLASEPDRRRVLGIIRRHARSDQLIFIGVTDPIDPKVETPEQVHDRVMEAAEVIPLAQLGTTDDCGFSPFGDDLSTSRDTAFAKIRARVAGTELAARALGL
ncbi:MAG: 5-methyltetrahydropteroyltriglutamate--homocysteine methyltransferase [Acidobacteria bacterium]|nr:5-methyltetrahydropteroyltriglutamate--homocysteine methyltransferase [Acidobacteriota bacterium]